METKEKMMRWTGVLVALCLGLASASRAATAPADAPSDHADERHVLDLDLARFQALIEQDTDPVMKTTLRGYQQEYARRANLLIENFDAKKYDDLRYDINVQCQRQARKLAPLDILPRGTRPEDAGVLPLNQLDPSPGDPAEVKAALDAADDAIRREEVRVGQLPVGARERERPGIQRLKERRRELGKRFTKPAWDALVSELNGAKRQRRD